MDFVIAQVDQATMDTWTTVAAGFASLGFVAWYAWYTTTQTIPGMNSRHAESMRQAIEEFRAEAREQRLAYQEQIRELNELNRLAQGTIHQFSQAIHELKLAMRDNGRNASP